MCLKSSVWFFFFKIHNWNQTQRITIFVIPARWFSPWAQIPTSLFNTGLGASSLRNFDRMFDSHMQNTGKLPFLSCKQRFTRTHLNLIVVVLLAFQPNFSLIWMEHIGCHIFDISGIRHLFSPLLTVKRLFPTTLHWFSRINHLKRTDRL